MFEKITQLEDRLITYVQEKYPEAIEEAKKKFLKDDNSMVGFEDWLIYGYEVSEGKTALNLHVDDEGFASLKGARYSFYEPVKEESGLYFKDIFTNEVYKMDPETRIGENIVACRIYASDGFFHYLDNGVTFDQASKSFLVKGLLEKYNSSVAGGQMSLEIFIGGNLLLLWKFASILFDIEVEEDDEVMMVHVCTYAFKDNSSLIEALTAIGGVEMVEDDVEKIYTYSSNGAIIAEIVLYDRILEVECNTKHDMELLRGMFNELEILEFVKIETLGLDDLL